ncbi:MAG: hypothetical protein ACR2KV_05470 [Solirubrobacteraceae bacterium]
MRAAFAVALLASAVLAACGSSANRATTTAPPSGPTPAEYIARANPICASGRRRAPTKRILTLIGQFPTPTAEIARLLRKTAAIVRQVRDELTAIPKPTADTTALTQWIAQNGAVGDLVTKAAGQVENGDLVGAVKTQQDISVASVDPLTFAKNYGLSACSTIGS